MVECCPGFVSTQCQQAVTAMALEKSVLNLSEKAALVSLGLVQVKKDW